MVTCWESVDLLAPLCVTFCCVFVTFQYDVLGQVWYLSWRRETGLSPSVKYVLLTVPRRYFFCGSFVLFMICVCHAFALFIAALWSPAGKGLASWLLFAILIVILTFSHVVSWVKCGT